MANCDPNSLLASAACFECLTTGQQELVKLELLAQILLAKNPSADVSPQGLLAKANCFSCYGNPPGMFKLLELQLLCEIWNASL